MLVLWLALNDFTIDPRIPFERGPPVGVGFDGVGGCGVEGSVGVGVGEVVGLVLVLMLMVLVLVLVLVVVLVSVLVGVLAMGSEVVRAALVVVVWRWS